MPEESEDEVSYTFRHKDDTILYERDSPRDSRKLTYSLEKCIGCGMCVEACPTEAIELGPIGAVNKGKSDSPHIFIDPEKCVLCGICSAVCLFGAIDVEINGEEVKESDRFVNYEKVYLFNQDKCEMKDEEELVPCEECKEACPREAITFAGIKEVEGEKVNTIERDESRCVYCTTCEQSCPTGAIKVNRIFEGEVEVDQDSCQGCGSCEEICPTGAIYLPEQALPWAKERKVEVDNDVCCFCSACENVCPVEAIEVKRSRVRTRGGKEKTWRKAWEKAFEDFVE